MTFIWHSRVVAYFLPLPEFCVQAQVKKNRILNADFQDNTGSF